MTGTANDNDALDRFPRGDAVGFRALVLEKRQEYTHIQKAQDEMILTQDIKTSIWTLFLSLVFWVGSLAVVVWSFYTAQPVGIRVIAGIALIWTALWMVYLSQDRQYERLGEIGILSALIGFISVMLTASVQMGFPMTMTRGLSLFCVAALLVSFLTHSRMALLASISACICWAALHMDGFLPPSLLLLSLPLVWLAQGFMAIRLNSPTSAFASVITAYIWIIGTVYAQYTTGTLSLLYVVGGTAILAALHYTVASTAHEAGKAGMPLHIMFSWALGLFAIIGVQHFCLSPEAVIWTNANTNGAIIRYAWLISMIGCIALIGLCGFLRQRLGRFNFATNLMLVAAIAIIPAVTWFHPVIANDIRLGSNMESLPAIGMFIAGIVFVSALAFTIKQFRHEHPVLGVAGLLILGLEASLSLKSEFLTGNYITMLMSGIFLSLAFMNILAQGEHNPHKVRRSLQYMKEA